MSEEREISIGELYELATNSTPAVKVLDTKFIEQVDLDRIQVWTDTGWVDAVKIHKTVPYRIWQVVTSSHSLKCADTHIVFKQGFKETFVNDLAVGDKIMTENGLEEVEAIMQLDAADNMYDIELAENSNHRYYTDGILSHNTTTYTVFCLWYATMFRDKKVMICANKLATAIEIMDRIRKAYENLPFWIKPGILTYNKGEIEFANGSVIRACSTSSSAARGSSCNCVEGNTKVAIRLFGWLKLNVPIKWLRWL